MGRLIYSMNVSLDGYVETPERSLDWATVDDDLHRWFNDQARDVDASLYGRRMYELMTGYWPTADADPNATPVMLDFARIWTETPKIVFSTSLDSVIANSRLVHGDPGVVLADLRDEFAGDLDVGGPNLAGQLIERGLVDEYRLIVHPVILGGGTPFFPGLQRPIGLRLLETRTFASGAVYLGFAAR
jgi:dihydrofolate reductase